MADDFSELRRGIYAFLLSLKRAIDRPFRPEYRRSPEGREQFMRSMLMVEEARIQFSTYNWYGSEPTEQEWIEARTDLLIFIDRFIKSPIVDRTIFERPFRVSPSAHRDRLSPLMVELSQKQATVREALIAFREIIEQSTVFNSSQVALDFEDLKRIVPQQQVAPAQFEVSQGRIILADQTPATLAEDRNNLSAALEHIRGSGKNLIESLEKSNCDRRLLDSVKDLHTQITSDGNIVRIGLTNMACGVMSAQFHGELPDALNAMFSSYSASISMYVAQFPEWEQFTERAASIDLNEDEIAEIDASAAEMIAALEARPELADPEVPKTIKLVHELMTKPGNSLKRTAFAVMRTIENLVASILRYSVTTLSSTAEKTVEKISTVASTVIAGLLGIALLGATGIGSAAGHAGAPWVKKAAEVVQKQIEKLGSE